MIGKMFMLNLIYGVALLVSAQASATGVPVVSAAEAKNLAGQYVTVCGSVSEVKTISRDTFINLEGKHPNQPFYFYHYGRAFPDKKFISKDVCGTGIVLMHKNKSQIIIESPDELTIQAEKPVVSWKSKFEGWKSKFEGWKSKLLASVDQFVASYGSSLA